MSNFFNKLKQGNYNFYKSFLYDKNKYIENYIDYMFSRTQKMFNWHNLPSTIPQRILENFLQYKGNCIFTEYKDNYYIFTGGFGGVLDEYYQYTEYNVANPYLGLSKTYKIKNDTEAVLIRNDSQATGLLPILSKNAVLMNDVEISLHMLTVLLRVQYLLTASDDKTKMECEKFLQKLSNGDFGVIANNAFLDSLKTQSTTAGNTQLINQIIQLAQYIKASAFNDIGINANYHMKKERVITSEIEINESTLLPLVENFLEERKNACERINKKYGLNIDVELSCVWKTEVETHENINNKNQVEERTEVENANIE